MRKSNLKFEYLSHISLKSSKFKNIIKYDEGCKEGILNGKILFVQIVFRNEKYKVYCWVNRDRKRGIQRNRPVLSSLYRGS